MSSRARWAGLGTLLSVAVAMVALFAAAPAQPAVGDISDLAVTKADSPDPVRVGETLTYTIQVTNLGPQDATKVTVTDKLPAQTDFVSATSTSGTCAQKGTNVVCEIGNVAATVGKANAVTVTIQVRPTKPGTIVNEVSIDSVENDPVGANDKAQATTQVLPATGASCRGVAATIVGTGGSERLVGTGGPDVIAAFGGDDEIVGLAGRDLICAGAGNDTVAAGPAADRVFGGVGRDRLLGRGGPDLLAGNAGNDLLKGGGGADRLRGGSGFDRCIGGFGLDRERSCEL